MPHKTPEELKNADRCTVTGGTHKGKAGTIRDIHRSKTGHITITVVQDNGERFKTLGKNVAVLAEEQIHVYKTYIAMKPDNKSPEHRGSNPANWKWGVFYFNPGDKRIFPPKRNKYLGWTVNFANPLSILAFVLILGLLTVAALYLSATCLPKAKP